MKQKERKERKKQKKRKIPEWRKDSEAEVERNGLPVIDLEPAKGDMDERQ